MINNGEDSCCVVIDNMSEDEETADMVCCASCGKAEVDNIKLKICTACKLVKYCSVECQKNHRPMHKKACKKRAAELRDDKLFRQPEETHLGECPICCLPLSLDETKLSINSCCCKYVCRGCVLANSEREMEMGLEQRCPFCRELIPEEQEEGIQNYVERAKANDPVALFRMGAECHKKGDYEGASEYWKKAAQLGNVEAHYNISISYGEGEGVEKDIKKKIYHLEVAALGGHPTARYNLANHEGRNGREDRAYRHLIIAANLGLDDALDKVKEGFIHGLVSKEDYESALRGHQTAVDATKSQQREKAEKAYRDGRLYIK
jgi:hypothetical protein